MKPVFFFLLLSCLASWPCQASTVDAEIEHLLETLALSNCSFIRNGKEYDGQKAASHLRYKYKRAGSLITSTEDFIDYLGSKSSISKKPYLVRCKGIEERAGSWLHQKLTEYRQRADPQAREIDTAGREE